MKNPADSTTRFNKKGFTHSGRDLVQMIFIKDRMADYRQNEQGIWAGEKEYISLIREFLAHDLECKINPGMEEISRKRHLYNFKCFADNHDLFENVGPEYLELAKKYGCQTVIRALESKHLFTDDWEKDNRTLRMIFLRIRLKQLPIAPYLVVRKIWRMING